MQNLLNWHLVSETASTTVGTTNREMMPLHNDAAVVSKRQQKPNTDQTTQSQQEAKKNSYQTAIFISPVPTYSYI